MRTAFSAHYYLGTSHGLRLGFPKSPYFENPIQMETRDDPIDDLVGGLVVSLWPIICIFYEFPSTLSAVRHESPSEWIFKIKGVLESQDAELEMSQCSYVPKTRSS